MRCQVDEVLAGKDTRPNSFVADGPVHSDGTALETLDRLDMLEMTMAFQAAWFPSRRTPMTCMILGGQTCEQDA